MAVSPPDPDRWSQMEAEVRAWRQTHPDATFSELEAAVDARLDDVRADLLGELAPEVPASTARCPRCGGSLVQRGTRTRSLVTRGDRSVTLSRPYLTCAACGAGRFPPR